MTGAAASPPASRPYPLGCRSCSGIRGLLCQYIVLIWERPAARQPSRYPPSLSVVKRSGVSLHIERRNRYQMPIFSRMSSLFCSSPIESSWETCPFSII